MTGTNLYSWIFNGLIHTTHYTGVYNSLELWQIFAGILLSEDIFNISICEIHFADDVNIQWMCARIRRETVKCSEPFYMKYSNGK